MELYKKSISHVVRFCVGHKTQILFCLLLLIFIFLRFFELSGRASLGWDQADSAWAAKSILLDNPLRLQGVPIKGNASMYLGPIYYYLITPFYYFTNLDMIAGPIFAGVISVMSLFIIFYISKKIFDTDIALMSLFFYTFSVGIITADRIPAAYILIPIISYTAFYFLYKFVTGKEQYILYFFTIVSFGFHVHITTLFYFPIFFLTLPFIPKTKKALYYMLVSMLVCLIFVSPIIISVVSIGNSGSSTIVKYLVASYHGFHTRRFLQLSYDAFMSFQSVFQLGALRPIVFFIFPIFSIFFYRITPKTDRKNALLLFYLMALWIIVPWILLSTYNGELTNYYFSLPQNFTIAIVAFFIVYLYKRKVFLYKLLVIILLLLYAGYNLNLFFNAPQGNYLGIKSSVNSAIQHNVNIEFKDRDPTSFIYYAESLKR